MALEDNVVFKTLGDSHIHNWDAGRLFVAWLNLRTYQSINPMGRKDFQTMRRFQTELSSRSLPDKYAFHRRIADPSLQTLYYSTFLVPEDKDTFTFY